MRAISSSAATGLPALRPSGAAMHVSAHPAGLTQVQYEVTRLPRPVDTSDVGRLASNVIGPRARGGRRRRRGVSVVLIVIVLVILIAFVSLAVDFGRVWLARAEMQTVADAAARAGALSLPVSNQKVLDNATEAALNNPVLDTEKNDAQHLGERTNPGVELDTDSDIVFGRWDGESFHELEDLAGTPRDERRDANAVLAWGRRIEDRDNSLPLIFGPVLGMFHSDIERRAIAAVSGGPSKFGFIGIDEVTSNGNGAVIDSMHFGRTGDDGGVASDGNIDLGNGDVYGDVRPGMPNGTFTPAISQGPNSDITGWTAPLDFLLKDRAEFKIKATPGGAVVITPAGNANLVLPPANVTPSNDPNNPKQYVIKANFTFVGNRQIQVRGYVHLYVEGNFKIDGSQVVNNGSPANPSQFEVFVTRAGTKVDLGGNATQYMHVHAPGSDVTVHGSTNAHFYGWIVGKTLAFRGTSNLHYDDSRTDSRSYQIQLVK